MSGRVSVISAASGDKSVLMVTTIRQTLLLFVSSFIANYWTPNFFIFPLAFFFWWKIDFILLHLLNLIYVDTLYVKKHILC
jgi:hypothetical protein